MGIRHEPGNCALTGTQIRANDKGQLPDWRLQPTATASSVNAVRAASAGILAR
jgi:hypothetical protein